MLAVGEDLGLVRQVRSAAVDEIDARQPVLERDFLRAEVLLHGQRIVGPALHRRVVADDHHLPARHAADAGDHARAGHFVMVQIESGELADLEERRARIEQALDAVARKQFAALDMALAVLFRPALRRLGDVRAQLLDERAVMFATYTEIIAVRADASLKPWCAHALCRSVGRKCPAPA